MNNPTTHTTTTPTATTTAKPTTMDKVKEKATLLADKITGRQHDPNHSDLHHDSNQPGPDFRGTNDITIPNTGNTANTVNPAVTYHAGQHPIDALNANNRHDRHHNNNQTTTMPLHTGAAVGDAAVPHGNTVDRTAYQDKLEHHGVTGHTGPAVPPKDDHTHHGIFGHNDKHKEHHTTALGGANAPDPNLIHPSVVPHQQTTAGGLQNPGVTNVAGPTGTSHVPTYTQNMPPAAIGTVPVVVGQTAQQVYPSSGGGLMGDHHDRHNQAHLQNTMAGTGATTTAAGTHVPPMNTNNSAVPVNQHNMHQTNPVHSTNNAAPAPG